MIGVGVKHKIANGILASTLAFVGAAAWIGAGFAGAFEGQFLRCLGILLGIVSTSLLLFPHARCLMYRLGTYGMNAAPNIYAATDLLWISTKGLRRDAEQLLKSSYGVGVDIHWHDAFQRVVAVKEHPGLYRPKTYQSCCEARLLSASSSQINAVKVTLILEPNSEWHISAISP